MGKKVLVISSSFRKGGNSELLAKEFIKGAEESGNDVEFISLAGKNISFCRGCQACHKTLKCVINDDAVEIAEKMRLADVLVFVTPVYYFSVSGQLKTMLDRANPLYTADYNFRHVYLLSTAAEDGESTIAGTKSDIEGWVACFEKASFVKTVFAGGVGGVGAIKGHKALAEAYETGLNV